MKRFVFWAVFCVSFFMFVPDMSETRMGGIAYAAERQAQDIRVVLYMTDW